MQGAFLRIFLLEGNREHVGNDGGGLLVEYRTSSLVCAQIFKKVAFVPVLDVLELALEAFKDGRVVVVAHVRGFKVAHDATREND